MKPTRPLAIALLALALSALPATPAAAAPEVDPTSFRIQMELANVGQARAWLDAGLDPDYMGDNIGSGLMIGAWEGKIPLMALFHARGADIDKTNRTGDTALMLAALKGHLPVVQWLLDRGARVNAGDQRWSALHYAVFAGHGAVARELVARGADIDARTSNGSSVLMLAIYEGRDELAEWLLQQGAERGARNDWGDGAVEWAMKYNRLKIARALADAEAFAKAASVPKEQWGEPQRSLPADAPSQPPLENEPLDRLLQLRELLVERRLDTERIDQRIAAERARQHRAGTEQRAVPATNTALEIRARRGAPTEQKARLVVEPR